MVDRVFQNVLILTDDAEATRVVLEVLAGKGIRGMAVADVKSASDGLGGRQWDLVFIDLDFTGPQGFELLRAARRASPELSAAMLSSCDSAEQAVRALRAGCADFLTKPLSPEPLAALIEALLPNHPVDLAAAAEEDSRCLYQIAGVSPAFLETVKLACKVAPTSVPVLITGESGTGKELLSYLIHRQSSRRDGPYIRVNCAAVSESLLESELFGHERGAFTGAYAQRKGRFERAHGGTLLLDEVSETGTRLQAELLRVLEQQDFERLGGSDCVHVNVRVVSTSNRNLAAEVEAGRFRRDLYYRICGVHLDVPPLRHRQEDIEVLVWHIVNQFAREVRRRIKRLDGEMMELFARYPWPGNVRQLRNVVRTALILGEGPTLSLDGAAAVRAQLEQAPPSPPGEPPTLMLHELERQAVLEALRRTKRNQVKAAKLLGITDRTLREKLRRYRQNEPHPMIGDTQWLSSPV